MYRRKSVCGGELPGFPNKLFLPLARRETLQSKDHPSVRLPPTASTRRCSSHPSSSTQHPLQEGPNTDMLYTFSVVESFQRALMEKRTNIHTGVTPLPRFHSSPHSKLSFLFTFYHCCCGCFVSLLFLFLPSESSKEKWTLDGLLKLCNVKAKQMCFCYLCL